MTYVVQEPCVDCKYGDCAEVCPVGALTRKDSDSPPTSTTTHAETLPDKA